MPIHGGPDGRFFFVSSSSGYTAKPYAATIRKTGAAASTATDKDGKGACQTMRKILFCVMLLFPLAAHAQTYSPTKPPGGIDGSTVIPNAYDDGSGATMRQIAHMADGSVQQTDIGTKVPSLDPHGRVTAPVATDTVTVSGNPTKGLSSVDPVDATNTVRQNFNANTGEWSITSASKNNVLALVNTNPDGFSAVAFAAPDERYGGKNGIPSIHEFMALGHGSRLGWAGFKSYNFHEDSYFLYGGNFSFSPPPAFLWQSTGLEFIPYGMASSYALVTAGSNVVTCPGGCTFPGGTGNLIDAPGELLFPEGTTIVSGAGTSTLTLSDAAVGSSADAIKGSFLRIGSAEGSQHDWWLARGLGNVELYTFGAAKWGVFTDTPFFVWDRVNGRTGIRTRLPVTDLDVKGSILANPSGQDADWTLAAPKKYGLNAQVTPGDDAHNGILHAFGVGDNQYNAVWLKNPSRIQYRDSNGNAVVAEHYMDGTWASRHPAHPIQNVTADFAINSTDQCDTTLVVNSASAVSVTVTDWLLTGCRITVTQAGSGAVTLVPASGLTLASNSESGAPATGNYVLAGQYASVVLEAKSAHLTTVERGQ